MSNSPFANGLSHMSQKKSSFDWGESVVDATSAVTETGGVTVDILR